ncbi:MAG: hypothetical protein WCL39_00335 [Armatimonadota bacterium]
MRLSAICAVIAGMLCATAAHSGPFSYLDSGFTQEIYAAPLTPNQEAGMAWTSSGNLLTRAGSTIIEYKPTQSAGPQGTNVHGVLTSHPISGLASSGYGMTKGLNGYIYTQTAGGLQRFDPNNWASAAVNVPLTVGGYYGITTLPDGRIAYNAGPNSASVYIYDPVGGSNTLVYTSPGNIDDIEASSMGVIALAGQMGLSITIISSTGAVINTLTGLSHHPDGLAFGEGPFANALFSNNNDGSITQYMLGPGYTGVPVITDIATSTAGSRAYGDLASVGPDCAFYVTQYDNGNANGSNAGIGTHWDNGNVTNEASIIRIALGPRSDGSVVCGFGYATENTPEPGSLLALGSGLIAFTGLAMCRK